MIASRPEVISSRQMIGWSKEAIAAYIYGVLRRIQRHGIPDGCEEDVKQEAALRVWSQITRRLSDSAASPIDDVPKYVRQAVRNAAYRAGRRFVIRKRLLQRVVERSLANEFECHDLPDLALSRAERIEATRMRLGDLSCDDQRLLRLYKMEGLSDLAVAIEMGISPSAVRMRFKRLKERLQIDWCRLA